MNIGKSVAFGVIVTASILAATVCPASEERSFRDGKDGFRATDMSDVRIREGSALDLTAVGARDDRWMGFVAGWWQVEPLFEKDPADFGGDWKKAFDEYAVQVRRQGFNIFRFHGLLDAGYKAFDHYDVPPPDYMDKIDYLAYALGRNGVRLYVDLVAYGMRYPKRARRNIDIKAGVMFGVPRYLELWEKCVRAVLDHKNPYTGKKWKDDENIVAVCQFNEQSTGAKIALEGAWRGLDPETKAFFLGNWKEWMLKNGRATEAQLSAFTVDKPLPRFYSPKGFGRDLHLYMSELSVERTKWYDRICRDAGCKSLLTSFNSNVDWGACAARWSAGDAVPYNIHQGHPFGGGHGYKGAKVDFRDSFRRTVEGSSFCYGNRIKAADRPFIVTEFSHAFWNPNRYEIGLLTAYHALNGYKGLIWHAGGTQLKTTGKWPRGYVSVFEIGTSPCMRAAAFLGSCLYLRGDVRTSAKRVSIAVTEDYWRKHSADAPSSSQARIGLICNYGIEFPDMPRTPGLGTYPAADVTLAPGKGDEIENGLWVSSVKGKGMADFDMDAFVAMMKEKGLVSPDNRTDAKKGIYESETGEILIKGYDHYLQAVTPLTEAVCLEAGTAAKLGRMEVRSTSANGCVAVTSIDGQAIGDSRRMVFLYITREANEGMVTSADGKTMVRMGSYPALLQTGAVDVRLDLPARGWELYMLDYSGKRLEKIPVCEENGKLVLKFDTAKLGHGPTPFFELVRSGGADDVRAASVKKPIGKEIALGEVHRGVTLGFYAPAGYYGSREARDEVDRIAASGATWIVLTPNVWQEGRYSTVQFNDFMKTQSDLDILDLCDYIHSKGLRVTLRPMLECFDGTDRMYIDFEDDVYRLPPRHGSAGNTYCSRWFESMKARTLHYAAVAERCRCEVFCIDSELDRMADYAFNGYWKDIVAEVRKIYTGALTSCHTRNRNHGVKWDKCLEHKDFWLYDLDFLQISDYVRPVMDYEERSHSVEEMVEGFKTNWLGYFRDLAKRYGKPIQFGEFGCTSSRAAARSPAGNSRLGYDGEEQARFLEAFMRVFWKEPWCRGFYWWKWDSNPEWYVPDGTTRIRRGDVFIDVAHSDPARQREILADLRRRGVLKTDEDPLKPVFKPPPRADFAVYGKPAADVMRKWYTKADHSDAPRAALAPSAPPKRDTSPIGKETALKGVHHGMSIGLRVPFGYFSTEAARKDIDAMAEMGVDWVVLCVTVWQEGRYSPLQFADFGRTPGEIEILDICNYIHSKGMHVMLRPMEEAYDGTDRMYVDFENDVYRLKPVAGSVGNTYCSRWFRSVKARSIWYARVAERCRCEAFCLDSEMDRMADYAFNGYWKDIVSEVRKVYTGALTSCHTRNRNHGVKWDKCLPHKDFWLYDLDFLQISDYVRPVEDYEERPHSVEEMVKGFEDNWLGYFRDLAKRYGKPIHFGEFGCTSSRAGARGPAVSSRLGYDGGEQARFLEAFMRVFSKEPWCRGYYWWCWGRPFSEENIRKRQNGELGANFCPYGKPVAEVFKKWYGAAKGASAD